MSIPAMEITCPVLPPEIWTSIIESLAGESSMDAWLNCRRVSRMFQSITEAIFARRHIRTFYVARGIPAEKRIEDGQPDTTGHLLAPETDGDGSVGRLDYSAISFEYSRFSEDGERVILSEATFDTELIELLGYASVQEGLQYGFDKLMAYALQHPIHGDSDFKTTHTDQASEQLSIEYPYLSAHWCNRLAMLSDPPFEIILEGIQDKAELPGLECDRDKLELSIKWKPMLSLYYGKRDYGTRLLAKHRVLNVNITGFDKNETQLRSRTKLQKISNIKLRIGEQMRRKQLIKWQQQYGISVPSEILREADDLPNLQYQRYFHFEGCPVPGFEESSESENGDEGGRSEGNNQDEIV
ncbi:hypothetical protein BR93DRAFT_925621 [Coniochaeta sp. PMI_546]|nr:hypothetical protein BR93DRAFT_925621 [Coniochaeta sp. PMI_546]